MRKLKPIIIANLISAPLAAFIQFYILEPGREFGFPIHYVRYYASTSALYDLTSITIGGVIKFSIPILIVDFLIFYIPLTYILYLLINKVAWSSTRKS